ncbi:hypothetical protein HDF16_005652 [Granulicella aggregans]|uniref:Uncharacterized protein n=1 Tax=Granulicella aggregans TaxID=474949 RepID=A0A7W8E6Q5_9BACT|nr:hypothetical protein [Granulicella aggregans]MBB5060916.1 hypothetical protein [Granulicella aggregans]
MKFLLYLAGLFIDTFGITHPSDEARYQAARYIAFLLLLTVLLLCTVIAVAAHLLHR